MLSFLNPDDWLIPNMMIDTSPWSSCSRQSPWLPCSGHMISSTGPSVSPFRDFCGTSDTSITANPSDASKTSASVIRLSSYFVCLASLGRWNSRDLFFIPIKNTLFVCLASIGWCIDRLPIVSYYCRFHFQCFEKFRKMHWNAKIKVHDLLLDAQFQRFT